MLFLLTAVAVVAITFTILSTIGEEKKPLPSDGYGGENKSNNQNRNKSMNMQPIPVSKKTASTRKESPVVIASASDVRDKNKKMNSGRR